LQHFGGSTGYGHDDAGGREALDSVFAHVVGAEAAIVRPQVISPSLPTFRCRAPQSLAPTHDFFLAGCQFFSGTHAIACALFALLRPGHEVRDMAEPKQQILALFLLD
jgi:cystathionine beta-lyase family protein involved in aluminum resistance